jgi:phage gpG-like protein
MATSSQTLTIELRGMDRLDKAFGLLGQWYGRPQPALKLIGGVMIRQVRDTFARQRDPVTGAPWNRAGQLAMRSRPGGGGRGKTLSDTGRLLQSIMARAPRITGNSVSIGTNVIYGSIHQEGGTIKPKNAKMLAIPLTREARRAGSASRWWKQNESKNPFIWKGIQRKNLFIVYVEKRGKSKGKIVPMFLLLPRVTIPQRRFLGLGLGHMLEIEQEIINASERVIAAISSFGAASRSLGGAS